MVEPTREQQQVCDELALRFGTAAVTPPDVDGTIKVLAPASPEEGTQHAYLVEEDGAQQEIDPRILATIA